MDATRKRIERMEEEREERRKEMNQRKLSRKAQSAKLLAAGNPGDVDFIGMVEEWRAEQASKQKERTSLCFDPYDLSSLIPNRK